MEKAALVLSGGGAKGLYHIGAWKALIELKIPFQAVFGNSVGALVAGFIAQGDYNQAQSILSDLDLSKVVKVPDGFLEKGFTLNEAALVQFKKIQKSISNSKGLDTAPLRELLEENLDEKKIRNSGLDFGIVTFQVNKMKEREVFIDEIEEGNLISFLMASATFPGFKLTKIGEDSFIDGGVSNNIPLNMARERGYRNIIVIDIGGIGVNKKLEVEDCTITYIKNKSELGGILDFDKESMKNLKDLGYRDTLRIFGNLEGISYYFRPAAKERKKLEQQWLESPRSFIPSDIWRDQDTDNINELKQRLQRQLPEEYANHRDWVLVMAECSAMVLNLSRDRIYNWKEFIKAADEALNKVKQEVKDKLQSFNGLSKTQWIKKGLELTVEFQTFQKDRLCYYFLLSLEIRKAYPLVPVTQLESSHPQINPARLFLRLAGLEESV